MHDIAKPITQTCQVNGCDKKVFCKELCAAHYKRKLKGEPIQDMKPVRSWKPADPRYKKSKNRICDVPGCERPFYAKGLCHRHHARMLYNGFLACKVRFWGPCKITDCQMEAVGSHGFCRFHYERRRKGTNLKRPKGIKGSLNHNWNGGVAQYPNHSEMKRVRLRVLERDSWTCQYCGKPTKQVHHIDGSKNNHAEENLIAACHKCNLSFRGPCTTSKYIRLYGKTLTSMAKELGCSTASIATWHREGKLRDMLLGDHVKNILW